MRFIYIFSQEHFEVLKELPMQGEFHGRGFYSLEDTDNFYYLNKAEFGLQKLQTEKTKIDNILKQFGKDCYDEFMYKLLSETEFTYRIHTGLSGPFNKCTI